MEFCIKIYNRIIKILGDLIPEKIVRKFFKAKFSIYKKNCTSSPFMKSKVYGKIYYPRYSKVLDLKESSYELYNKGGNKLVPIFLRNDIKVNYNVSICSNYLYSDHFNFSLKNHLYFDTAMLEIMGNPQRIYGMLTEARGFRSMPSFFPAYRGVEEQT